MKIELDKAKKIILLQAIADGAIERETLADWVQTDLDNRTEDEIIDNIIRLECTDDENTICKRRLELSKCPYNKLAKTFIQALENNCMSQ